MTNQPPIRVIWDMDTVAKVSRLFMEGWLAYEELYRSNHAPAIIETMVDRMCSQLIQSAHTFAVEVNRNQLKVDTFEDPERNAYRYRVYWKPQTRDIELRGGHLDGEIHTVQNIWVPLNIPQFGSPVHVAWEAEDTVTIKHLVYKIAGWSETDQRWIFDLERT